MMEEMVKGVRVGRREVWRSDRLSVQCIKNEGNQRAGVFRTGIHRCIHSGVLRRSGVSNTQNSR